MDTGTSVWVVVEADDIHHVFETASDAITYSQTVADVEGHGVRVEEAMFNAVGVTPDGA